MAGGGVSVRGSRDGRDEHEALHILAHRRPRPPRGAAPRRRAGRPPLTGWPWSRTGENPPYGISGETVERSASFEARSAPPLYPTPRTSCCKHFVKEIEMETKGNLVREPSRIRETIERPSQDAAMASTPLIKTRVARRCEECRVDNAFHAWRDQHLTPSFNWTIDFTGTVNIPAGKRAVIEVVTATITVPSGERARLRMYTSLGFAPSNLDFVLTSQGQVGGRELLVATHSVRCIFRSPHRIQCESR